MKIHCNIIQDLLPLYYDGICSKESAELIEEHLRICQCCAEEWNKISVTFVCQQAQTDDEKMVAAAAAAWKKGKRKAFIRGCAIALAVVILWVAIFIAPYTKQGMKMTVTLWGEQLTEFATARLEDRILEQSVFGSYRVVAYPDAACVFFQHTGWDYDGFFYSANGAPVGFQGTVAEFEKHGAGWMWKEQNGDNWMYVEQIEGNWYWYEMNF